MPAGLQVWNEQGKLVFDGTKRISRVVVTIDIRSRPSGSYSSAMFSTGSPFAIFTPTEFGAFMNNPSKGLNYSFSGDTFSWTKDGKTNGIPGYFVVGVY